LDDPAHNDFHKRRRDKDETMMTTTTNNDSDDRDDSDTDADADSQGTFGSFGLSVSNAALAFVLAMLGPSVHPPLPTLPHEVSPIVVPPQRPNIGKLRMAHEHSYRLFGGQ
jgi:hypothetical protein